MEHANDGLCPQGALDMVVGRLGIDDAAGLRDLAELLQSFPLDPRLNFLQGSVLVGLQRYEEGRRAMARAVEIAPDFTLARFQLGFLDLTSGRAIDAVAVWTPLGTLSEDDPLRVFAEGLIQLTSDNFAAARELLERGIALNTQNPLVNADMQLILDEMANSPAKTADPVAAPPPASREREDAPGSAVDLLLRQSRLKGDSGGTRH